MKLDFEQLPLEKWTAGPIRTIAKLRTDPAELGRLLGIQFSEAEDDFDKLKAAYLRVRGRPFLLLKRVNDPDPGTEVQVRSLPKNARDALIQFLEGVGLSSDHVQWTLPDDVQAPAPNESFDWQVRTSVSARQARNLKRVKSSSEARDVVFSRQGTWLVLKRSGSSVLMTHFATRNSAELSAARELQRGGGGEIRVWKKDGNLLRSRVVARARRRSAREAG